MLNAIIRCNLNRRRLQDARMLDAIIRCNLNRRRLQDPCMLYAIIRCNLNRRRLQDPCMLYAAQFSKDPNARHVMAGGRASIVPNLVCTCRIGCGFEIPFQGSQREAIRLGGRKMLFLERIPRDKGRGATVQDNPFLLPRPPSIPSLSGVARLFRIFWHMCTA